MIIAAGTVVTFTLSPDAVAATPVSTPAPAKPAPALTKPAPAPATPVVMAAPVVTAAPGGKALDLPHVPKQATAQDMKIIRALDGTYQKAASVKMDVDKTLKLGLLQQERKAKGSLLISSGRLRLELTGEEKTLLIVNNKNYWAVTYPSAEFKEAPVQVIEGLMGTKKGRSQSILGLLTQGGFLKFFNVSGVQKEKSGETTFFLQPQKSASEFKRAELKVSADGKEIRELHYWDERDNETLLAFKGVNFGKKPADTNFNFEAPPGAEVMKM